MDNPTPPLLFGVIKYGYKYRDSRFTSSAHLIYQLACRPSPFPTSPSTSLLESPTHFWATYSKGSKRATYNFFEARCFHMAFGSMIVNVLLFCGTMTVCFSTGFSCSGYFCDKHLDGISIIMTHNSLAVPGLTGSPNQHKSLAGQFRDGIRGFNLDLYDRSNDLWTYHGIESWGYNPAQKIRELVEEMNKPQNINEFVLVQLQDEMEDSTVVDGFLQLFGSLLITGFDSSKTLAHYIDLDQRVLIATSRMQNVDKNTGMHNTRETIIENHYEWDGNCYFNGPAMEERYESAFKMSHAPVLMNNFCTAAGGGNLAVSSSVNRADRILYNVRRLSKESYTGGKVNIIFIDYYDVGSPFDAQKSLREGDANNGCWGDSRLCGVGTTCWKCCNPHTYWWTKAFTACGNQPCISGGKRCLAGTSCRSCCNGSKWVWRKFGHFCK